MKRVALALAVVGGFLFALGETISVLAPVQEIPIAQTPTCGTDSTTVILMAQAVPSATAVPCIAALPPSWEFDQAHVRNDHARFSLHSDERDQRLTITFTASCDLASAQEISREAPGITTYEAPNEPPENITSTRLAVFAGGCVRYELSHADSASSAAVPDDALGFTLRVTLVRHVEEEYGLELCGAHAECGV